MNLLASLTNLTVSLPDLSVSPPHLISLCIPGSHSPTSAGFSVFLILGFTVSPLVLSDQLVSPQISLYLATFLSIYLINHAHGCPVQFATLKLHPSVSPLNVAVLDDTVFSSNLTVFP
jgi:hypothetical protein